MEVIESVKNSLTINLTDLATNPYNLKVLLIVAFVIFVIYNLGFITKKYYLNKLTAEKENKEVNLTPGKAKNRLLRKLSQVFEYSLMNIKLLIVLNFIILLTFSYASYSVTVQVAGVKSPRNPALGETIVDKDSPMKIVFDRPIKKEILEYEISPETEGSWEFSTTAYGPLIDTLIFTPKKTLDPETRYTIYLRNIESIFGSQRENFLFSFLTPSLPNIESTSLDENAEGILPNQEIIIKTDKAINGTAHFTAKLTPDVETLLEEKGENELVLKAKDKFKKSTSYKLEIERTQIKENYETGEREAVNKPEIVYTKKFSTIEAPGIKDYGPKGSGVLASSNIFIEFKQDMDKEQTEKAFSLSPNVAGDITWEGARKLIFNPSSDLSKNTSYTYSISTKAKTADGSLFEESFSNTFTTIGHVKVSSFYPYNNQKNVGLSQKIAVTFNQAVDHASAESKFSISPAVPGSFSWSGNTMYYNHSKFSYYKKYTIRIGSGVKSIYGLDGNSSASATFTTKQQSVVLNVPSYAQSHMYSCMAVAARDALAYRGVYLSENYILSLIGYDKTPFSGKWGDPNAIWGDPYSGIVGDVDGRSGGVNWGYGAYWGPTAKAISKYRPTEIKSGWTVQGIAQEIAKGNPVLVWWVNGVWPAYTVKWKTPSGKSIRGVNSMHVQTVKGFTGTVENPTSFIVNDSGYGYPQTTYSVSTFKAKWSWFGNTAVVVK